MVERRPPRWLVIAVPAAALAGIWLGAQIYRLLAGG
jgi:hypothetical protein